MFIFVNNEEGLSRGFPPLWLWSRCVRVPNLKNKANGVEGIGFKGNEALHSDSETLEIGTLVLGYSLVRSLVRSHRSLIRLLRIARASLRSFVRSLTHSLAPKFVGQWNTYVWFFECSESLCLGRLKRRDNVKLYYYRRCHNTFKCACVTSRINILSHW